MVSFGRDYERLADKELSSDTPVTSLTVPRTIRNVLHMTNTANAATTPTTQEVTMYQLPGHTLIRATIDAEYVIEGDRLVTPFGDVISSPVEDVDMETPFIARFELTDGTATRRFAGIAPVLQVTILRNVPLTD